MAAAQRGDSGALNALLRRHYDRIYAVCRRLAGNDADALDATQEALLAITKGIGKFSGGATFRTWSYRVATNACLDELRRRGRRPTPSLVDEHEGWAERQQPNDAPELASQVTDRLVLDAALADLPEDFRAPIVLRDQLGMDYAEIASVLDVAPGTVRSRIARGRRRLATALTAGGTPQTGRSQSAGNQTGDTERPSSSP